MKFVRVAAPTNADEMRAYLERKTVLDEITDCAIWQGHAHLGKYPMMRFGKRAVSARRVVFNFLRRKVPADMQVGVPNTCHCLCMNPEHLVARTKAQAGKGHAVKLSTKVKISQAQRRKSKLDHDTVQAIRASAKPCVVMAAEHQVSVSIISRIRRGDTWREYTGPWAGLMRA
jgi:hypothetical protein